MAIEDLFSESLVIFNLVADSKAMLLEKLTTALFDAGKILNREEFIKAVLKREAQFSTGIGMGIAIPHAKGNMVKEAAIAFAKLKKPVEFDSIDGDPISFCFLIAVPREESDIHLKAISQISRKLMHRNVRERLISCNDYKDFIHIMRE